MKKSLDFLALAILLGVAVYVLIAVAIPGMFALEIMRDQWGDFWLRSAVVITLLTMTFFMLFAGFIKLTAKVGIGAVAALLMLQASAFAVVMWLAIIVVIDNYAVLRGVLELYIQ